MQGMDPAQYNQAMLMLQQMNPELAQRLMAKTGVAKFNKLGLDPFQMLAKPGSVHNLPGMDTDMESPWAKKDEMKGLVAKILASKPMTTPAKEGPKSKGPNENSPNKKYLG
jgi:hypothetical protein